MANKWKLISGLPAGLTPDTMLLLSDGSVLVHNTSGAEWWRLTPDGAGQYDTGAWGGPFTMANTRQFFASGVLRDGRVFAIGGEYSDAGNDTPLAEIFDPLTNTWSSMNKPSPAFDAINGDVSACILADGRVLCGGLSSNVSAIWDPVLDTWTIAGTAFGTAATNKDEGSDEETWTLLPDGTVLTVDISSPPRTQKYDPGSDTWVPADSSPATLTQQLALMSLQNNATPPVSVNISEIGPAVVLPNGRLFAIGATGHTALYIPPGSPAQPGSWAAGPDLPPDTSGNNFNSPNGNIQTAIDAPCVLLPGGKVLLVAGNTVAEKNATQFWSNPSIVYVYDPATNATPVALDKQPTNNTTDTWQTRFLLLPTGQVLFSSEEAGKLSILTPDAALVAPDPSWRPTITSCPTSMAVGHHYKLYGTQLNGLSQACAYGDDAQMATNFPIVQLTMGASVHYVRSFDFSTLGIATGPAVHSTLIDIPASLPTGSYELRVIANGIPSDPVTVTVAAQLPQIAVALEDDLDFATVCAGGRAYRTLTVFNVGNADLIVDTVSNIAGSADFTVLPNPATPLTIESGDEVDFTIEFTPTTSAFETATIRITSNDPVTPNLDVDATGIGSAPALELAFPDAGQFGKVCLGSFVDRDLVLNNRGPCDLQILAISSSSPDFVPPGVFSYPLVVAAGDSIELPIRFQPTTIGSKSSTISVLSNDPTGPKTVVVSGTAPAPRLTLMVPGAGDFGEVRLGKFTDRDLVINNQGSCQLTITGIVSSAPTFVPPQVASLPLAVEGGGSVEVPIRFQPTNRGAAAATLTIFSNDPSSPAVVGVSGTGWPPLPVAGTALEGFRLSNDSQHVFFTGTDKFLHELDIAAGSVWADHDLTTLASAVPPSPTTALAGFRLSDDSKHVFFIGTDGDVYEYYFTAAEGWVYNDVTALARAVAPVATSELTGHALGDDSKHVFLVGTDGHVHELFIGSSGRWADNDLTALAGGATPRLTTTLTSHRLGDDSQHVFFIGTDGHVHELFIGSGAGASWADNDLTALAGAMSPNPATALTSYRLGDDSQHVFFIGTDSHVHELFIGSGAGASWADNDLTAMAGAVISTPGTALTGFPLGNGSQHVFFIGADSHVHELDIDSGGSWADHDLTTLAGAVPPIPATGLTGYPLGNDSKHVFFIGAGHHVHELFFTAGPGWVDNDLTALT
ncbi:choice-of-anchor D domain-containing protein [Mycobacterium sp. 852013-50091_SCH5140682]|uniref:choice-of-anchor D domain-containing protein n=1 Tax=Mycobacterium sp. 852013-50091_SCH5140682 TaxID=1834109 RepID=UPI000AB40D59|nr:choice-of-anchor D domain-containing protein [Mycobacterium sp. 852013-50091_SCH5140682]